MPGKGRIRRRSRLAILPLLLLFITPLAVQAAVLTFEYDTVFSGDTPGGTAPWLTATFDDQGATGSVTLALSAAGLTGNEFVTEWDFNSAIAPTTLAFNQLTGPVPTISQGLDAFKADGDGSFDIMLLFDTSNGPNSDRFGAGESATFLITGPGITVDTFNALSVDSSLGPFLSAAHIQGIGGEGEGSGWIAPGPDGEPVPEPGTVLLLVPGLVGLAAWRRRRP